MTQRNASALKSPVMGRVMALSKELDERVPKLPKRVQHLHGNPLLVNTRILYKYALRQVKGNGDYFKRTTDLIEEMQADIYFIHSVCNCWNDKERKIVAKLDAMCDEIVEHLYRLRNTDA